MSIATNQLINEYYNRYRENELVFTKDIMRTLRIDPRQIYVKCAGSQWPCIINSTSFQQAKIIVGTAGGAFTTITKKDAPPVSLRYGFTEPDGSPLVFFVTCRVTDVTPYMNSHDLAVITLSFTQRPPDDLIYKLGTLLAADDNFTHRKEDRIVINADTKRALGIDKKETIIYIQNIPRRCILWNLSFSGVKVVLMGIPKFLQNKDCVTRFMFSDPDQVVDVKGTIVTSEPVENRQALAAVGIKFDENQVPLSYKKSALTSTFPQQERRCLMLRQLIQSKKLILLKLLAKCARIQIQNRLTKNQNLQKNSRQRNQLIQQKQLQPAMQLQKMHNHRQQEILQKLLQQQKTLHLNQLLHQFRLNSQHKILNIKGHQKFYESSKSTRNYILY